MVSKPGDHLSKIIIAVFVLIVVVFIVVFVREAQKPRLTVQHTQETPQTQAPLAAGRSEIVVTFADDADASGQTDPSQATQAGAAPYLLPQDVTMEMVDEMVGTSGGGVTLYLKNGQKMMVSAAEMSRLDPTIRLYTQYNREQ